MTNRKAKPDTDRVSVALVVDKDNRVLMVRRKIAEGNLVWVFPGGKLHEGERPRAAMIREVKEETGIQCRTSKKIGQRLHPQTRRHIHYFLCKYDGPDFEVEPRFSLLSWKSNESFLSKDSAIEECRWMEPNEVFTKITSDLFPKIREELEKLGNSRNKHVPAE